MLTLLCTSCKNIFVAVESGASVKKDLPSSHALPGKKHKLYTVTTNSNEQPYFYKYVSAKLGKNVSSVLYAYCNSIVYV